MLPSHRPAFVYFGHGLVWRLGGLAASWGQVVPPGSGILLLPLPPFGPAVFTRPAWEGAGGEELLPFQACHLLPWKGSLFKAEWAFPFSEGWLMRGYCQPVQVTLQEAAMAAPVNVILWNILLLSCQKLEIPPKKCFFFISKKLALYKRS